MEREQLEVGMRIRMVSQTSHKISYEYRKYLGRTGSIVDLSNRLYQEEFPVLVDFGDYQFYISLDEIDCVIDGAESDVIAPDIEAIDIFVLQI